MSTLQRVVSIAFAALLATPAAAGAATPPRGPEATVRAYVDALRAKDVARACEMLDPGYWGDGVAGCRSSLRAEPLGARLARVRIEPGALTRGARARVVVALVVREGARGPWAARARVVLRHVGGRWQIRQSGPLPGIGRRLESTTPSDVVPSGTGAALRRLADDELLAVSGNEWMLCDLLAPDAPLGSRDGGCGTAGVRGSVDDLQYAARADRVTIHRTGADRARLDVAFTIREAVRTTAKPGWRVRTHHRKDTLYAVRSSRGWRLAKLSRWSYQLLGIRPPDDAAAPTAKATWPFADVPSLSEHPVGDACRRPFEAWGRGCSLIGGLAVGGGLVAWSWLGEKPAFARPVAAGLATGAVVDVSASSASGHYWVPAGAAPVTGGALVFERDLAGDDRGGADVRAVPVGPDGRPRGDARLVGKDDSSQDRSMRVVPGPPGATTATIVLASGQLVRLDAVGRAVGAGRTVLDESEPVRLLARPDGTLLAIGDGPDGGSEIRALSADGRPAGTLGTLPSLEGSDVVEHRALASAADGRALAAWIEVDHHGRGTLRAWAFDPTAPSATAPAAIALAKAREPDAYDGPGTESVVVDALPGGGWGIAWMWLPKGGGLELWAARLNASGTLAAAPRRVTDRLGASGLGGTGFGLTGDTVAFIEWPELAGLPQVRAAPLP